MRIKKWTALVAVLLAVVVMLSACAQPTPQVIEKVVTKVVKETVIQEKVVKEAVEVEKEVTRVVKEVVEKEVTKVVEVEKAEPPMGKAKYVFLFVGDGMAVAQRNAAELYLAATKSGTGRPEDVQLLMNTFPTQGMNTTYDLTSVIPDSASTATALSTGYKTASGVVGMDKDGKVKYTTIAEKAKASGMKVGIISSVSIDHATPAAFYAHQPTRKNMYEITMDLANSGFDLFAGGPPVSPMGKKGDQPSSIEAAEKNGYQIVVGRDEFDQVSAGSGKVWMMPDYQIGGNALYYEMDRPADDVSLPEYVEKAIELLDNSNGFFMAIEGGKIDWACHANDAAASIHDTLVFDEAIGVAYEFYQAHPDETLIVVTGDHETGGMTIGFAGTKYSTFFEKIKNQKISQEAFANVLNEYKETHTADNAKLDDMLPAIEDAFGLKVLAEDAMADLEAKAKDGDKDAAATLALALSELELEQVEKAFVESMLDKEVRSSDQHTYLLYGGYEPLAIKCTTILNQKAGISWTSYSHTGIPVQTSAIGVGHELFAGYYDQPDIHTAMMTIAGLK